MRRGVRRVIQSKPCRPNLDGEYASSLRGVGYTLDYIQAVGWVEPGPRRVSNKCQRQPLDTAPSLDAPSGLLVDDARRTSE